MLTWPGFSHTPEKVSKEEHDVNDYDWQEDTLNFLFSTSTLIFVSVSCFDVHLMSRLYLSPACDSTS